MTREEVSAIADDAAERAVEKMLPKMLIALGLDTTEPLKVQAMMLHVERQYEACQTVKQHSLKTAIGVVVTSMVAYVLLVVGWNPRG